MHRMHALCLGIIVSVCVSVIPVSRETHHNEVRLVHVFSQTTVKRSVRRTPATSTFNLLRDMRIPSDAKEDLTVAIRAFVGDAVRVHKPDGTWAEGKLTAEEVVDGSTRDDYSHFNNKELPRYYHRALANLSTGGAIGLDKLYRQ
jgi:hypothetical protein